MLEAGTYATAFLASSLKYLKRHTNQTYITEMKILDDNKVWGSKVNFVDENNIVLGYDLSQKCCERAGWFIADEVTLDYKEHEGKRPTLDGWNFDAEYYKRLDGCEPEEDGKWREIAVFRITNGDAEKFIHLFNSHNGYYSHGFELEVGGTKIKDEYL